MGKESKINYSIEDLKADSFSTRDPSYFGHVQNYL